MPPVMYKGPGDALQLSVDGETYTLRRDLPVDVPESVIDAAEELEGEEVTTDVELPPAPEPEPEPAEVEPGEPIDPDAELDEAE